MISFFVSNEMASALLSLDEARAYLLELFQPNRNRKHVK